MLKTFAVLVVASGLIAWDLPFMSQRARGDNRYREGKYEEAIDHYGRAVEHEPGSWELHYNLGTSYYRTGDWEKAVEELKLAADLGGKAGVGGADMSHVYHNLGLSYLQLDDCENAIPALNKAIEYDSTDEDIQRNAQFASDYCESQGENQNQGQNESQGEGNQDQQNQDQNSQDQNQDQNQSDSQSDHGDQQGENGQDSENQDQNQDENQGDQSDQQTQDQNGQQQDQQQGDQNPDSNENQQDDQNGTDQQNDQNQDQNGGAEPDKTDKANGGNAAERSPNEIPDDGLGLSDEQIEQILRSMQEREWRNAPRYFRNNPDEGDIMDPETLSDMFRRWFLGLPPESNEEMPEDGIDW
jgi:Ca-activated chloride channel family protein